MSLAGSRFSSESAPRPLYGAFLVKRFKQGGHIFFPSSVSLFDLKVRFFVPIRAWLTPARPRAVKVGRRINLAACSALARLHLDGFGHDGAAWAVGMTIRGEPAF